MNWNYGYTPTNNYINPINNYAQQKIEVIRVNGKNGAESFQLPPNSSALLLDSSMPLVWFVQTDGAGYKTCTPYKVEPYQVEQQLDTNSYNSLDKRIKKLEDLLNAQSNNSTNEQ